MLTQTGKSISFVAQVTGTGEVTRGVGTDSIRVTVISISGTLINICNILAIASHLLRKLN